MSSSCAYLPKTRPDRKSLKFSAVTVRGVFTLILTILGTIKSSFKARRELALENLALRHQVGVLTRTDRHPRLGACDRGLWVVLCRHWSAWRGALAIVQPATVLRWHREGFRRFWTRAVFGATAALPSIARSSA